MPIRFDAAVTAIRYFGDDVKAFHQRHLVGLALLGYAFLLTLLGGLYYVCFHFGWGMDVHSWAWIIGLWVASLFAGGIFSLPWWGTPRRMAVKTAIYLVTVFCLSCWAIIYGWGMHPRNWWLVVIPYCIAGCFPPFNTVSRYLLWWRKDINPTMAALVALYNAGNKEGVYSQIVGDDDYEKFRDALTEARRVFERGGV